MQEWKCSVQLINRSEVVLSQFVIGDVFFETPRRFTELFLLALVCASIQDQSFIAILVYYLHYRFCNHLNLPFSHLKVH